MESARLATRADLQRVADLAVALVEELRVERGGELFAVREAPPAPLLGHYESRVAATSSIVGVGLVHDTIVGFVSVAVERLGDGTELAVIEELFVEPEFRAIGVGECLADLAVDWARDRGCRGVDARALPGNRAAKNFFETHGFVARSIVMHRRLDPRDGA